MTPPLDALDLAVRRRVYDVCLTTGETPLTRDVGSDLGVDRRTVLESFQRLATARMLVLQPSGEILMAMPFSAVPTPFLVRSSSFTAFANCGWDALGVGAMLGRPVTVVTSCPDCGDAIVFDTTEDAVSRSPVLMHFALPVRRWWESVVFT